MLRVVLSLILLLASLLIAAFFAAVLLSTLLMGKWMAAGGAATGMLLASPWPGRWLGRLAGRWGPGLRLGLGSVLAGLSVWLVFAFTPDSIYATPQVRARVHRLYEQKMQGWPLAYDDIYIATDYGAVHVIVSGAKDGPPMLLLPASGLGGWSWKANAAELGLRYRLYAIDSIGDLGKSEYTTLAHVMQTGEDQAELYAAVMEALGISTKAIVVGASEGGFIASNLALYHPERVARLILLGPMGYVLPEPEAELRFALGQLFPHPLVQDATLRWVFSDSPALMAEFGPWFRLLMSDCTPSKVAPLPLSRAARRSILVPTFFVFGARDNLVGDPLAARALVSDMANVRVEVVRAGHLMGIESPHEIDTLILAFAQGL